jgi:hypothetical protein
MKCPDQVFGLSCSLALLTVCATAGAGTDTGAEPAEWMPHDMIVKLRDLPKRYSCNDLWYRSRDVLLAIGARPNVQILTHRFESALGPNARSPRVFHAALHP